VPEKMLMVLEMLILLVDLLLHQQHQEDLFLNLQHHRHHRLVQLDPKFHPLRRQQPQGTQQYHQNHQ
jgi:hypothetical protein